MNSNYLSYRASTAPKTARKSRRGALVLLGFIMSLLFSSFGALGMATASSSVAYAEDDDSKAIWEKVICWFPEDTKIRTAYQLFSTSDLWFYMYSKSTIGITGSDHDGGFNSILDFVNSENGELKAETFKARNERILGLRSTKEDPTPIDDGTDPENENDVNRGKKISFYDRFGIAGLSFSSYSGEWRHFWINACDGTKFDNYQPETTVTSSGSFTLVNANARDGNTLSTTLSNIQNAIPSGAVDIYALQEQNGTSTAQIEAALPGYTISRTDYAVNSTQNELGSINKVSDGPLAIASLTSSVGAPTASGTVLVKPPSVTEKPGNHTNRPRYAYWVTYESGLTVINTHLQTCGNRNNCDNFPARKAAINKILELANQKATYGAVIITGDFNDGSHSSSNNKQPNMTILPAAGYKHDKPSTAHPNHTYYSSSSIKVMDSGNISQRVINAGTNCAGGCYDHDNGAGWGTYEMAADGTSEAKIATWNILGSGHTDGDLLKCRTGRGSQAKCGWPDSPVRTPRMLQTLEDEGISLAALQEVHARQFQQIRRDGTWAILDNSEPGQTNNIIYKKDIWRPVQNEGENLNFKIFYHKPMTGKKNAVQAVQLFEHKATMQQVYVMSIHNTINRRGSNWKTRISNLEDEISVINSLSSTGVPIILAGDFNDGSNMKGPRKKWRPQANSWCVIPPTLSHSFGTAPDCVGDPIKRPDGSAYVDHIYLGNGVGSSNSKSNASVIGKRIADHPLVTTEIVFGMANSGGSTSGLPDGGHGQFYKERLIPRSTWGDRANSEDPRTKQFANGIGARIGNALITNLTNWIFGLSKGIVVLTIAIVGLAFTDVAGLLGVTELVVGKQHSDSLFGEPNLGFVQGNSSDGIVGVLYQSLFGNLVVIAFILTACWMAYYGLFKKQYRQALGGLIKSIGCLVAAVIIFTYPKLFVTLPNNIAVIGQVFTAGALNMDATGESDQLCVSDVGVNVFEDTGGDTQTLDEAYGILDSASIQFRSAIGCHMWRTLLFRPWVEGQFHESDYKTLNGKALVKGKAGVKNRNTDYQPEVKEGFGWVGRPEVPRGNGESYENWALFHISTQTDVHVPYNYAETLERSEYTQEAAVDWWRIVDAFSNYQESLEAGTDLSVAADEGGSTIRFSEPLPPEVLPQWNTWVGNDPGYRLGIVMSSIFISIIVAIAPLFFSMLAVVYSIGLAILMMVAPLFFLLGCWAGRGWEIFKAWADMVVNLVIKRIMLGVLLVFTLKLTTTMLDQMDKYGYWQTIILIILLTVALIMSKDKILGAAAGVRMSSVDLGSTASRVSEKTKNIGFGSARAGASILAGGVSAKRHGGGFASGLMQGAKAEMNAASYRSSGILGQTLRNARQAADSARGFNGETCGYCKFPLGSDEPGFSGQVSEHSVYGYIHYECGLEMSDPEGMLNEYAGYAKSEDEFKKGDYASTSKMVDSAELSKFKIVLENKGSEDENMTDVQLALDAVVALAKKSQEDVDHYRNNKQIAASKNRSRGRKKSSSYDVPVPNPPREIATTLDQKAYRHALVDENREATSLLVFKAAIDRVQEVRPDIQFTEQEIMEAYAKSVITKQ